MDFAKMIDHTLLKTDATKAGIDQLLSEAKQYHFASVARSSAFHRARRRQQ